MTLALKQRPRLGLGLGTGTGTEPFPSRRPALPYCATPFSTQNTALHQTHHPMSARQPARSSPTPKNSSPHEPHSAQPSQQRSPSTCSVLKPEHACRRPRKNMARHRIKRNSSQSQSVRGGQSSRPRRSPQLLDFFFGINRL